MSTRTVVAAFAALQLAAAAPALAEVESNGPGGGFAGWTVPAGMRLAPAASAGSETYTPSPCFGEAVHVAAPASGPGDAAGIAWPAMPLGGSDAATYARASGPRAPRG